ncbi:MULTISPECIES: radical SAM/SPASM domain-containing protein [Campylobacter]|uniref:radical SAM/SPASM domain-containing protein n=1 Tax=Campylobacter TaxID=194 RepID=UPI0012D5F1BA|nr:MULTISPECIES: radical SAM protein [Campylobacter]ECQ6279593.1 radical SAM protein [Campylobacter coli]EDO9430679.1 radical SAM protein [Campylobacter coli]EDO9541226.1 radical SAM protein [Campylobacter coli]EIN8013242.1 radical SAM protein [Campylobacter coli]EIY3563508.1 radical SAM protein [Campylobacter coli]
MIGKILTFVPNSYCNFACSYCYLGKLTERKEKTTDMAEQFKKIAKKLKDDGVIITEVILHGAELSASPYEHVKELLKAIDEYKKENHFLIRVLSKDSKKGHHYIHLKTNLYFLDRFFELFKKYEVGISASIDLPLRFHEKYRVLKSGKSTLEKTLKMIELLSTYPYFKQISTTMTKEHLNVDEFIRDVYKLESLGFDMASDFYIMFTYQSANAQGDFQMPSDEDMLSFYKNLREKLKDTKYSFALEHFWFKEFLGGYCTNCTNCGDNLLIQKNGDVYVCHRSQALNELRAGNIFNENYESLKIRNITNIRILENSLKLHKDCLECDYFHLCKASCTIERNDTKLGKSYTCALQKAIYKNNAEFFKADKTLAEISLDEFLRQNQTNNYKSFLIPNLSLEFRESKNSLENIINDDEILQKLYLKDNFLISVNDELALLDFEKDALYKSFKISSKDNIKLLIKKEVFDYSTKETLSNFIYMSLLGGEAKVYGDEKREKTLHIETKHLYLEKLLNESLELEGYLIYDISSFLKENSRLYSLNHKNFIFFTTKALREYHYEKQAKNAFYHAQTINLPFLRFEFTWEDKND